MNPTTEFLLDRPYREVVEDLLTAIVGGIVNEPIIYDVKTDFYPLAQPARDLRRVTGRLARERYTFQRQVDFNFSEADNGIVWEEGGSHPDDETSFFVDYFAKSASSPLTDINDGSVTRTLCEAIGREIATVYAQIKQAYDAGFLDSAGGRSLEFVVSILQLTRKTKAFAQGSVTFFRSPGANGNITLPQGLRLATTKGEVIFETIEMRTLQAGQQSIVVPISAGEAFGGEIGQVDSDTITLQVQPIEGIGRITNLEPTLLSGEDESDAQLRDRARARLRSLGKASIPALKRVVAESRAKLIEVRDPASSPLKRTPLGTVNLFVETEPEKLPSLQMAINETRAAGVRAQVIANYVYFKPRLTVQLEGPLSQAGNIKVIEEIIAAMQTYVDKLGAGESVDGLELIKAIESVKDVAKQKTRIEDVLIWRTDINTPSPDALVQQFMDAVEASATDKAALSDRLSQLLREQVSPFSAGSRIPDRSFYDAEPGILEKEKTKGAFKLHAQADQWLVLDMEISDVVLQGGS